MDGDTFWSARTQVKQYGSAAVREAFWITSPQHKHKKRLGKFKDSGAMKVTIATTKFKYGSTPDYIDSTFYIIVIAEE